jgi:hypothetical protein
MSLSYKERGGSSTIVYACEPGSAVQKGLTKELRLHLESKFGAGSFNQTIDLRAALMSHDSSKHIVGKRSTLLIKGNQNG